MNHTHVVPFSFGYLTIYPPHAYYLQSPMFIPYQWFPNTFNIFPHNQAMEYLTCNYSIQLKEVSTNDVLNPSTQCQNNAQSFAKLENQNRLLPQSFSKIISVQKAQIPIKIVNIKEKPIKKIIKKPGVERFIKKNTESNIVNQTFSFLWSQQKSTNHVKKITNSVQQYSLHYKILQKIKKHFKKQINRFYLKKLCNLLYQQQLYKKLQAKIRELNEIDLQKFSQRLSKLMYFYLRQENKRSIITSKKMNNQLWKLHLQKSRQLKQFLFMENKQEN